MNIVTLDFETFFDHDYTLSRGTYQLTTEEYVRHPRFEAHGCSFRSVEPIDFTIEAYSGTLHETPQWFAAKALPAILGAIDWSNTAILCQHAHFDALILSHHYGIIPAMIYDTLPMGRVLLGNHLSVSLDSLAKHFGLAGKIVPYDLFRGKHWYELTPDVKDKLIAGCNHDVALTWDIFCRLAPSLPAEEFELIDSTIRMFTQPELIGNTAKLGEVWTEEVTRKQELLAELGVTGDKLRKDEVFAQLLRDQGIEPAMKPGKPKPDGTPKWNYAFAKTDDFMRELLEDDDDTVVTLAEARISEKSNGMQTRSERLGWMSTRGAMCVYLNYAGAHTTRFSGGDKVNWQNLKRGGPIQGTIEAPPGKLVITRDASQIECRVLNMVAGQHDVIERFRNHEDPYVGIATKFYGFQVTKAHEKERGTGKQLELSCGYGAGGPTIKTTAKKGTYGPPVFLTDDQAMQARDLYRQTHPAVTGYWRQADDVLKKINANMTFEWGPLYVANKRIYLPNGLPLIYETLEWHVAEDGDSYGRIATRHGRAKLYGAKLVENVIQALARLHTTQAWLRCVRAGIPMKSMEHDKLIALVHEHEAEAAYEYMGVEMSRAPEWLPGIPLDSEGYISNTFAKPEKTQ